MNKITFVTHAQDPLGLKAIKVLEGFGCQTVILSDGQQAPEDSIALYTNQWCIYANRHARMAAHRLNEIPNWALSTPFIIALRENRHGNFAEAIRQTALDYEHWLTGRRAIPPWGNPPTESGNIQAFEAWKTVISNVPIGTDRWFFDEGLQPPKRRREKSAGKKWMAATSTVVAPRKAEVVMLSLAEFEREAAFVALIGAFNYDVSMSMDPTDLHFVFQQLVKRLALVAESAATGGGAELFKLTARLTKNELLDAKSVMPQFEAILLYGKPYDQLSPADRLVADQFQISDEQSHFSRIMDVDALRSGVKRQVGVVDAGNPLIARMLMNAARYREDLGVKAYWPLPYKPNPESADYHIPLAPAQVRKTYPYVTCTISASTAELAKDLMEIYRLLISQYPLEIAFLMMEEWLMTMGQEDVKASFTAAQLLRTGDTFQVKLVNVGGGAAAIRGSQNQLIHFTTTGQEYDQGELAVGRIDFQQPHHVHVITVQPGDKIFVFPKTRELPDDFTTLHRPQEAAITVNTGRHNELTTFTWIEEYITQQLAELFEQIAKLAPDRVELQFGHVHGDRDPNEDQVVGAKIAGAFARMLMDRGIRLVTRPMSDNYHVVDRLDFPRWITLLMQHSGLPITEVTFEDALISRHLGDEATARLYQIRRQDVIRQGVNYYYRPPEVANMMIELYDGVRKPQSDCGRMGCVNFQIGYELYRLNPDWINAAYRTYIMTNFPQSLVAQWWENSPAATYQELVYRYIYLLPVEQRMTLKARVDEEIDRPYAVKCASGQTPLLDGLLSATDTSKIVLIHVLEGFYDAQERKSATLWQALGLPRVNQWRISFNRHTGELHALDWNRHII